MANSNTKPSLAARALLFGSSFAAGAMMLSRMNRSEISRYDDLVSDLCCLPTPGDQHRFRNSATKTSSRRWMREGIGSLKSQS